MEEFPVINIGLPPGPGRPLPGHHDPVNKDSFTNWCIFVLIIAVIQAPVMYYYTYGLLTVFVMPPYMLIGAALNVTLLRKVARLKRNPARPRQLKLLISSLVIALSGLLFGEDLIEKADWHFRQETRYEIVRKVRNGGLNFDKSNSVGTIHLDDFRYFPPISNGGNDIIVSRARKGDGLTVEFFINRGFLDYSAFVYTDDEEKIAELESRIRYKSDKLNQKIENNWYRVSY